MRRPRLTTGWLATGCLALLGALIPLFPAPLGAGEKREEAATWWAYKPLRWPPAPAVRDAAWVREPIDAFILARLEEKGLSPAPPADRFALLRRVHYGLTGLPPALDEVEAFIADESPGALERVVERLLASPRYGEKWGRHWLDVVRYAETNGYERDSPKPAAWRYRDYVIDSFNADKPYDRFLREQIAGDELDEVTAESIIATGYYRLGIWDDEPADRELARFDVLDDILSTTSQAVLGMTIGCARCHDHKKDPIPQRDYYSLLAFIRDVSDMNTKAITRKVADPKLAMQREHALREKAAAAERLRLVIDRIEEEFRLAITGQDLIAPGKASGAGDAPPAPDLEALIREHGERFLGKERRQEYIAFRADLKKNLESKLDGIDMDVLAVFESGRSPTHLLERGSPALAGEKVEPAFPSALSPPRPAIPGRAADAPSSGKRRALAEWLSSRDNPLTARVLVNRIWQHHFGRGIVRSSNDFGGLGELPTHPELLDWLAAEFIERGFSIKEMHRLILRSSAYRMSSRDDPEGLRADPRNDLFWRFDMRRLGAEEVRDSILQANGTLNLKMAGPSIYTEVPRAVLQTASRPDAAWGKSPPEEASRRSVYIFIKRSLIEPILGAFDLADTDSSCAVRFSTTVPTQALTTLNSKFFADQAALLAARLRREAGEDPGAQARLGLRLATSRPPSDGEVRRCLDLIEDLRGGGIAPERALEYAALLMLNLNEFLYLD